VDVIGEEGGARRRRRRNEAKGDGEKRGKKVWGETVREEMERSRR